MNYFCAMARKKLARFAENEALAQVLEPSRESLLQGFALRGQWAATHFKNDHPIVLELGCGKGEYTVAMARRFPDRNFVGMDVKGARIWYGAKDLEGEGLSNGAFLRSQIELIEHCFAPGEVSEIWITFPDPQIKHARQKHRLTHPDFLARYARILAPGGQVHLKTDSEFLHGYTAGVLQVLGHPIFEAYYDIDKQIPGQPDHLLHSVQTHYEQLFRAKAKSISYLRFGFEAAG